MTDCEKRYARGNASRVDDPASGRGEAELGKAIGGEYPGLARQPVALEHRRFATCARAEGALLPGQVATRFGDCFDAQVLHQEKPLRLHPCGAQKGTARGAGFTPRNRRDRQSASGNDHERKGPAVTARSGSRLAAKNDAHGCTPRHSARSRVRPQLKVNVLLRDLNPKFEVSIPARPITKGLGW